MLRNQVFPLAASLSSLGDYEESGQVRESAFPLGSWSIIPRGLQESGQHRTLGEA